MLNRRLRWRLSLAETLMSQTSALDGALGENADADVTEAMKAEQEEKRIDKIMSYVTEVYQPDPSKLIMKGSRQFVFPHGPRTAILRSVRSARSCARWINPWEAKTSQCARGAKECC